MRAHFGAPEDFGIRVGDVIYEADGQTVTSTGALAAIVTEAGVENTIDVVLARDGARIVVGPQIERAPQRASRS